MTIKINKIEINGVRGNRFGQICANSIDTHGKTLLLYGSNGDGKSTLYDSLEWALTDNIEELKNRQMKDEEKYSVLKNKFCAEDVVPYVYIEYMHNGSKQSIKRELKPRSEKFPIDNLNICFIDLGRIERFVTDKRSSLWNRFSYLLELENFNDYIKKLERLRSEVGRNSENVNNSVESISKKIQNKKNELEMLGANDSFEDMNTGVEKMAVNEIFEKNKNLKDKIDGYKNIKLLLDNIKEKEKTIARKENKINEKEKKIENLSQSLDKNEKEVIKATRKFLNTTEKEVDICPVCRREGVVKSELIGAVENIWKKYEDLDLCQTEIKELTEDVQKLKDEKEKCKKDIEKEIKDRHLEDFVHFDIKDLDILDQQVAEYFDNKKSNDENMLKELENKIKNFDKQTKIKELCNNIKDLKEECSKEEQALERYNQILKDVSEIITVFSKKINSSIKFSLDNISQNDITCIYNEINPSNFADNNEVIDKIRIEADAESKEIIFQAKFKGIEKWDNPVEFLSTGHLRCLGFAILVAQAKRSGHKFYVFDDPISSIDFDHRYCLINYFNALASEGNQLIITTSDLTFYEIMQHTLNQKQVSYRVNYDINYGSVFYQDSNNYLENATNKLCEGDLRASSLYLRLYLETYISNIADKLKVKIEYTRDGKISHKTLIKPCKEELKNKCLNLQNGGMLKSDIDFAFNIISNSRYFRSLSDYPLNQMLHFPREERPVYCKNEIGDSIKKVNEFTKELDNIMQKLKL